jgi:membrane protein implicated in regulation of membrane protease activity
MLVYAAIGAVGLLFLLAMLFVGDLVGDHDLDHGGLDHDGGGPSFFSARVMASFVTAFGVGGVIGRYYEQSHPVSSGIGVAAGLCMATVVWQFARLLHGQQASSEVRMAGLVGRTGTTTVAIPDGGVGEVTLTVGGERSAHIARSADGRAIPHGTDVVVRTIGGDSIVVARADAPAEGGA